LIISYLFVHQHEFIPYSFYPFILLSFYPFRPLFQFLVTCQLLFPLIAAQTFCPAFQAFWAAGCGLEAV
jgi:hypothetical protein